MIWHRNEHLLCSQRGPETERQGANLTLAKQMLVIGGMAVISYFLAMQQSSALQEQIKDDRYLQVDEAVSHSGSETHAKFFSHHTANNAAAGDVDWLSCLNRRETFQSSKTSTIDSYSVQGSPEDTVSQFNWPCFFLSGTERYSLIIMTS